jgi:hypothetical protein
MTSPVPTTAYVFEGQPFSHPKKVPHDGCPAGKGAPDVLPRTDTLVDGVGNCVGGSVGGAVGGAVVGSTDGGWASTALPNREEEEDRHQRVRHDGTTLCTANGDEGTVDGRAEVSRTAGGQDKSGKEEERRRRHRGQGKTTTTKESTTCCCEGRHETRGNFGLAFVAQGSGGTKADNSVTR